MTDKREPILPAHIESTVQAIAEVHLDHQRTATTVQRAVDRMTKFVGRPRFVGLMTMSFAAWIAVNVILQSTGHDAFDPAPFPWLEGIGTLLALYITVLILITQRRENELTEHRQQLTLELSILSEQKTAKIIELIEELRRDHPGIKDRVNQEADEMSSHADPQAVLEAIKETHGETSGP